MKKPYRFIGHMHPFDFGGRERYETGRLSTLESAESIIKRYSKAESED